MINKIKNTNIFDAIAFVLSVLILSNVFILEKVKYGSLILLFFSLLVFFCYIFRNNLRINFKLEKFQKFILPFGLFCLISSLWAPFPDLSIEKSITIFSIILCYSLLFFYYKKYFTAEILLNIVLFSAAYLSLYTIFNCGLNNVILCILNNKRLNVNFANINGISILISFGFIICFYNCFYNKDFYYLLFFIPFILVLLSIATRKTFLSLFIGLFILIAYKMILIYRHSNSFTKLNSTIVMITILTIIFYCFYHSPIFALLIDRLKDLGYALFGAGNGDSSSLTRMNMIYLGIQQFFKTPILGIGIGNSGPIILADTAYYNSYLHNNYVELLACGGIFGFILFYTMYVYNIHIMLKYKKKEDNLTILCLILILCEMILEIGCVTYYSKDLYFYFMIFFMQSNYLVKNKKNNPRNIAKLRKEVV